ncbi:cytoplasmic dynein 2 light intermediate chain 1-like [Paramacrobiotus metropolitanus]|uniref:cytoplasmic dynein 2 light intermediate chain 1-like n=1 Tax=Paramacrobiotus metropolitanus TaxID=2943436 RepID=UPI002445CD0D|nr:cytoplasmic dynein 2 light intermediate chain 1-like [Paramacrobiotus metropolitanus]
MDQPSALTRPIFGKGNTTGLMDIWDCAAALANGNLQSQNSEDIVKPFPKEKLRNLLILGGKGAGKSTIIQRCQPNNSAAVITETVGLSYSFAIKQNDDEVQTANIWELGSCPQMKELWRSVVNGQNPSEFAVFLVFDLSRPEVIISIFETFISCISGHSLHDGNDSRRDNQNEIIVPEKLWLIGNKSDIFHTYELEKRQIISRCLHQCAKALSAGIMYTSAIKQQMGESRLQKVMEETVFGSKAESLEIQIDYGKTIFIPPDTRNAQTTSGVTFGDVVELVRSVRSELNSRIVQKAAVEFIKEIHEWRSNRKYAEPEIDAILAVSDAESNSKNQNRRTTSGYL